MFIKRHLDNSIPIVMERLKNFRSVTLGIWVKVGSRNETPDKNGISHFLEHMFFKGTNKRSAADIAIEIDSLGGEINAFTSRENTVFYVKVLDEYIDKGIELLADIFLDSAFLEEEMEKERGVIKEEIKLSEDTPDDYIHDIFSKTAWGDAGLGQPILGKQETVKAFTRHDLISHIRKYYGTSDTVIACAGNFEPDTAMNLLNHRLGSFIRGSEPELFPQPCFRSETAIHSKDISEAHICLGIEGLSYTSTDRYAMALTNTILGASMSSRLFQEIREKRGYAYSVYSFASSYVDKGYWAAYAGTGRKKAVTVTELIIKEMKGLYATISDTELTRAKNQLKGNLILGMESTGSRMQSIARQEIYYGRYFCHDEIMKEVEAVTLKHVRELSYRLINEGKISLTVLGPVKKEDFNGF